MENINFRYIIKQIRKNNNLTQKELGLKLNVSEKTISKWETGRGFPEQSIIPSLAKVLNISVSELFNENKIENKNLSNNIQKLGFYVCPTCNNVIQALGEGFYSCHGNVLSKLKPILNQNIDYKIIDEKLYVTINHNMTKQDYISFFALITPFKSEFVKMYPEQNPETYFEYTRCGTIFCYSTSQGLFYNKIKF